MSRGGLWRGHSAQLVEALHAAGQVWRAAGPFYFLLHFSARGAEATSFLSQMTCRRACPPLLGVAGTAALGSNKQSSRSRTSGVMSSKLE